MVSTKHQKLYPIELPARRPICVLTVDIRRNRRKRWPVIVTGSGGAEKFGEPLCG